MERKGINEVGINQKTKRILIKIDPVTSGLQILMN